MEKIYNYVLEDAKCDNVRRAALVNFLPINQKLKGNTYFQQCFVDYVLDSYKQNLVVPKVRQCGMTLVIFRLAMSLAACGKKVAIVMQSSYSTHDLLDKIMYHRDLSNDLVELQKIEFSLVANKMVSQNKIEDCCLMKFGESGELMIIKDTSESINCIRGKNFELDYIFYDEFAFFNMENLKEIHIMLMALNPHMKCIYASTPNSGDKESMEMFNGLINNKDSLVLHTDYTDMIREDRIKVLYEMARALPYDEFLIQCFGRLEEVK